jgi:hypothetical protein
MYYTITRPHKQVGNQLENKLKGELWFVFELQFSKKLWSRIKLILFVNDISVINMWIKDSLGYNIYKQVGDLVLLV